MGGSERGAAALLVTASLLLLIGVVALAVDGAGLYRERGSAQHAADNAAMAAAWADCTGAASPVNEGLAVAAANGYDNNGTTNVVAISESAGLWTADIDTNIAGTFSRVLGAATLSTFAIAKAECQGGVTANYAIFAGSDTCTNTIDWSGSNTTINGNVHSNNDFLVGGSGNFVNGDGSLSTGSPPGPPNVTWNPAVSNPDTGIGPLSYPVWFDIADFRPGGSKAVAAAADYHNFGLTKIDIGVLQSAGLYDHSTGTLDPGLYFTSNDIDLSASNLNGTVTFVTDVAAGHPSGVITFSGSNHNLTPYDPESLLTFSTHQQATPLQAIENCVTPAVKMGGSTQSWSGVIFAPYGQIEMSGSDNTTLNGSLIGHTVKLNGSSVGVTAAATVGPQPPTVGLRE